jgi:hypothetical protein
MNADRLSRRTSPGRDPVLLAMKLAAAVLAVAAAVLIAGAVHRAQAQAAVTCRPWNHPVWAQVLNHGRGRWICGESLTFGVKSR